MMGSHVVVDYGLEISFGDETCYILTSQQGDVEKATENGQSRTKLMRLNTDKRQ